MTQQQMRKKGSGTRVHKSYVAMESFSCATSTWRSLQIFSCCKKGDVGKKEVGHEFYNHQKIFWFAVAILPCDGYAVKRWT
jgi:hypothetical protein